MSPPRCSEASLAAGETLGATATTVEHWLLLEVAGTWPRDVGSEDGLPERAGAAARDWLARTPRSRLLFLRRPGRRSSRPAAYVVRADAETATVRRLELSSLDGLADADLERDGVAADVSLVLVCGHGTRDACCARLGTPVFGALDALDDAETWISSHQGGHRFAANVLVLPAGIQLGRVATAEAAGVVGAALRGHIELGRYRGRTFHGPVVQAAEIEIRRATGLFGTDDLRLVEVVGERVRFRAGDAVHLVEVEEVPGPVVPASCGAEPEQQPVFRARVVAD